MTRFLVSTLTVFLVTGLAAEAAAQAGPGNRRVASVAVLPDDATGAHQIHAVWSVGFSSATSVPQDVSTEVILFVNGAERQRAIVGVQTDGGVGFCGAGGCSGGCGTGYIDGVFNTLLCLLDGTGPGAGCECRFPWITSTFPEPLVPGDEVMVLLSPAPGALPDADPADDEHRVVFDGTPVAWDRQIASVDAVPAASGFDIDVEILVETYGLADPIDVTPQLELVLNGTSLGPFDPPCGPWLTTPLACGICDNSLCATITCNGETVVKMRCKPGDLSCGCISDSYAFVVPNIQLAPGDELDVFLKPVPGALPELPGFEDDEEGDVGRWLDLGFALAGTYGDPVHEGDGTLIGGDPVSLTLSNALENTTAYLVVGVVDISAPFKGGVLVPDPSPPGVFFPLPTGGAGVVGLAGVWPLGFPSGFTSYYQWWIVDPTGPVGFAASNALAATTP